MGTLAVNIASGVGTSLAASAHATPNSFLILTQQVNILIMGPAGHRITDFLRAGVIMTVLFLIVMLTMMNIVF